MFRKIKRAAFGLVAIVLSFSHALRAQETCITNSRLPYEWPSQRNTVVATNAFNGYIINTLSGSTSLYSGASNITAYEGTTTISDDAGNFLFYANGRKLYNAAGTAIYTGLEAGNENSQPHSSASQGIMAIRHPLNPDKYYLLTVDDALTGASKGLRYAVVDKDGTIDQTSTALSGFRTTEGITATWHENGVDIWVSVQQAKSTNIAAFLLRCDGFETTPVLSPVGIATVSSDNERGGMAFSWDSEYLAAGFGPTGGTDKVRLYNFDNSTGQFTFNKGIGSVFGVYAPYDMVFSQDNSRLISSSTWGHVYSINIASGTGSTVSGLTYWPAAIQMGADGNIYKGGQSGTSSSVITGNFNGGGPFSVSSLGTVGSLGMNTAFLPPPEEPDIQEVGPYCTTDPAVDLNTTWICAGTDAENPTHNPLAYTGTGITDRANGIFNPAVAGEGTHEIIFEYCSVNDTIWIVVNNCSSCDVELDDQTPEICVGETLILDPLVTNASADGVWTIDSMPTGTSPVITTGADTIFDATNLAVTDGTYKLLYTVTDGAEVCYDSIYIIVNPLPEPDLGNDTAICIGDAAVTFDPGTFASYLWAPGGEVSQTISTDIAGQYIVTVTDAKSCEASDTVVLTVNSLPTPDLGVDQEICVGDAAITFDAGAYDAYSWQPNSETTQTIDTDVADEYIVTVTDANGCEANDTVVLIVNPLPTPDLGNDTAICVGDPAITFDAGSYTSYSWQPNSETSQTITTDVDDTYIVTVTDANGCEANDTVILTVNPLPTPDLGVDQEICVGDAAITFDAGSYDAYSWQPNSETSQTITTDVDDEYIVTVTDANGCEANDTVLLVVNPLPTPDLGRDSIICIDEGAVTFDAGSYTSYSWLPNSETSQTITTDVGDTYILTVTDANGCEANDTVVLTVNPLPTPDLGPDTAICIGDAAVTFDAGSFDSYLWQPNSETSQTISTDADDTYIVTVTDANGCEANDTVILTVNPLPTPDLGVDQAICVGDAAVTFDAGSYDSYLWQPNSETSQTISTDVDDEYIVTVTDVNGCEANDTVVLTVNPLPTPDLGIDTAICANEPAVTFDAGVYTSYSWAPGSETSQTITTDVDGEYIVTVTDANGCEASDTIVLTVNPLPTPDLGPDTSICVGDAAIAFDAGSYDSYLWQPNSETIQTISTDVDDTYIVTVTDVNGCEANDTVVLTVTPLPTPDLGPDSTICIDEGAVTFDAGTYDSYLWQPNSETSQTISTDVDGEYIVTVSDVNGCEANDTVVLTVNPLPTPDLGVDQEICEGDAQVTFDAGTYDSYVWQPNSEISQTISTDVDGEYIVTVTDAKGCEANDTVVLIVNALPTPDLGVDTSICVGDAAISFDAGAYDSYAWQPNSETSQTISTDVDGEYIVTVTDANGCEASDTVVLTVNPLPTPDLGPDSTICIDEGAVTFDAGTYNSYLWQPNLETSQTISTDVDGEYIVTVADVKGCEANDTVVLTVNPLPTPDLGVDTSICIGDVGITFDAGVYDAYSWQPNSETTQTIDTDVDGEYIVTVTDVNGCEASDTVVLTVNPLPTPDLGVDQVICDGDAAITFDAGLYDAYAWQPNSETSQTISTDIDGEYIVTVTDVNGCEANDTVLLTVNPLPIPDLGADQVICEGDAAVTFDAGTFDSYIWQPNSETTQTIDTDVDGEYIVTVTSANGCEANDTVVLTVNPLPTPDLGADVEICEGTSGITFDAGTYTSYSWQPNSETSQTITTDVDGDYIVEVTDVNGCIASDTVNLTVNLNPTVDLGNDVTICPGSSVTLDAGAPFNSYVWNDASTNQTLTVTDLTAGVFDVLVVDANSCSARDTVEIIVASQLAIDLGPDAEFCDGNSITLDPGAITGAAYDWAPNGETTQTINVTTSGTYSVQVADPMGCMGADTIVITVNPNPTVDLGNDITVCPGFDSTFTVGTGWASVVWNDASTANDITVNTQGTYFVDVEDVNGCTATDTAEFAFFAGSQVDLGSDITICPGSTANFDAGTFASYTWHDGSSIQTYSSTVAEDVWIEVEDANGCVARDTAEVFMALSLPVDLGPDTALCEGETVNILSGYPSTGYTFLWSTIETTNDISVTTTGTYGVLVTDVAGCSGVDTINVVVNALPIVDLGPDKEVCEGFDDSFDAGAGWSTILWSTTETSQTITVDQDDDYFVTVTDANGCEESDTAHLTINANPIPDLGNDQTVCPGSSAFFNAGTYVSYLWHDASSADSYTNDIDEQVYVTVIDVNGCIGSDTAEIYIRNRLAVDLGPDLDTCDGNTIELLSGYAAALNTFSWNTGETTENIIVSTTGEYIVTVVDANGCDGEDTVNIIINQNPTIDLGPTQEVCDGDSFTFDAGTGWSTILWGDAVTTQTRTEKGSGNFTLTVSDVNGCEATDDVDLIVRANPTVNIGNDVEVCPGNNVTFSTVPNSFASYVWQDGSANATFETFSPQLISVLATDVYGCTATDTAELTNLPALNVNLPNDQVLCDGETYEITVPGFDPNNHLFTWNDNSTDETLTVGTSGTYSVFVSNGGGCAGFDTIRVDVNPNPTPTIRDTTVCENQSAVIGTETYASYLWSTGDDSREINVSVADVYSVTVTDINGCSASASGTFTIIGNPVIPAPTNQVACEGETITIAPTLPAGSYIWKPNGETTSSITVTQNGDYEVVVTNAGGCKDSVSINASFNVMPSINLGPDVVICEGETANIGFDGGTSIVSWDIGVVADFLDVQKTGSYEATITDKNGCSGKDTIEVTVSHNPTPVASNDTVVCMQEILTLPLTVNSGIRDIVTWSTGETTNDITIDLEGTYEVTAVNVDGCIGKDTVNVGRKCVSSIWVANAFTPDGNGINDFFGPKGLNITDFDFYVFNRWGEQIFHSTDMNNKWDGTFKGRECQIDVYTWKLYYRTEEDYGGLRRQQQVGTCTLYR